jgi:hypothetical protein
MWATLVIAMGVAWWIDHRRMAAGNSEDQVRQWLARKGYNDEVNIKAVEGPRPPLVTWDNWTAEGEKILNLEPVLRKLLLTRDPFVELPQVAKALAWVGNGYSVPALIDCLNDQDCFLRMEAAHALGRLGDEPAIEPLGRLFAIEPDENVRSSIVNALERIGGPDAVKHLQTAAKDKNPWVAGKAKDALNQIAAGADSATD